MRRHGCDPSRVGALGLWFAKAAWVDLVGPLDSRRLRDADLPDLPSDPVILLGHYRSGTTWLHGLLATQLGRSTPTNFQAVFPETHAMGDRWWKPSLERWTRRLGVRDPIHDRPFDWNQPAEDDVALATALELDSPSWSQVFGREAAQLVLGGKTPAYRGAHERFVRRVAASSTTSLLLQSPPQLAQIPDLVESFPDARFVFVVRDPVAVYLSSLGLWEAMARTGLHRLDAAEIQEVVLSVYDALHAAFMGDRDRIPEGRLVRVRYEALVSDPTAEVERICDALGLDAPLDPTRLEARTLPARPALDAATTTVLRARWGRWFEAFDYPLPPLP